MKGGVNSTDIQEIKKFLRAGHTVEAIAAAMNITVACVFSYTPEELEKLAARTKVAATKNAADHKRKKDIIAKAKEEVRAAAE